MKVTIIDTGIANIASVEAALLRENVEVVYALNPSDISTAEAVLLPGVGAFATGMEALEVKDFKGALVQRIIEERPTLGICLGMQLFCRSSEESPGAIGLSIFPTTVKRFPESVATPHFGWNTVVSEIEDLPSADAYFANSYYLDNVPQNWEICRCSYGASFIAAARKDRVIVTQFHPELSGAFGKKVLQLWLKEAVC